MSTGPSIFIVIEDTPETSTWSDDNGLDPLSDDDYSLFVENEPLPPSHVSSSSSSSVESSEFLYGHFDGSSLFVEEAIPPSEIVIPPSPKKTRLIQCHRRAKAEIRSCLRRFTENKDIIEVTCDSDDQIRFIADLSSEECVLLNLASPVMSMMITDIADDAGE